MKNLLKVAAVATGVFSFTASHAQSTGDKIKHDAKEVGHATAHAASSGAAYVVDKKYEGKCGPGGQTIFIDKYSHYYYVDKKGHHTYLKKSELRDKHDMKM